MEMETMMKRLFLLYTLLPLLAPTVAGQEAFELLHLHGPQSPPPPFAVSLGEHHLPLVSSSVLSAELWLRAHVLAHFPVTNITTIVVGRGTLCNRRQTHQWTLVLPSVKNLHHSLHRWGLLNDIKVTALFSPACFAAGSADAHHVLGPLLAFLHSSNLPFAIDPYPESSLSTYQDSLERLGFPHFDDIRVVRGAKPIKRKLSSFGSRSKFSPAPAPGTDVAADPPIPFCLPVADAPAPGAAEGGKVGLWCVAKPAVPQEKLQEAVDFACGEGGANCEDIRPNGDCFNPDNLVAHASYAFNSYWQKTKRSGGSCSFDGTAILINSDPSFLQCRFELS